MKLLFSKSNTIIVAVVAALLLSVNVVASSSSADSIVVDFDILIRLLEDTHPDPYTNYGGRVFFHKKANDYRRLLQADSTATANNLYQYALEFLSSLQDGHTFINAPEGLSSELGSDSILLVKFMCCDRTLMIDAIDAEREDLLGSRLVGINDVPVEKIIDRVSIYYPCENEFGELGTLCHWFKNLSFFRKIIGQSGADIALNLITPDGSKVAYSPKVIQYDQFGNSKRAYLPKDIRFPSGQMEWKEIDRTMFLCLKSVMARENFEFQYNNGWDFYGWLADYYRMTGDVIPSDTITAIKSVPYFSETFMDMLNEMKAKDIRNLVIDLRGNGGGWTPIVYPTLYMMFGDRYLEKDMDAKFYRRISELYLWKLKTDIASFNSANGLDLKIGDYQMIDNNSDCRSIEKKREDFLTSAFCSDSVRKILTDMNGIPIYMPEKIYVVTDDATFSAAFHYAFYLSKMGAVVAGETSSQAPNCYMEVTPFRLPMTGLTGSISNNMQVFLPADDPRSKEFTPELRLTYDDYRKNGFNSNSILISILENSVAN